MLDEKLTENVIGAAMMVQGKLKHSELRWKRIVRLISSSMPSVKSVVATL